MWITWEYDRSDQVSERIETLKHSVLQLEHAMALDDDDVVKRLTQMIAGIAQEIKNDLNVVNQKATGVYFKKINTIPFLYKPMYNNNPYEGNFLENFAKERTEQLKRAGAIGEHNKFWTDHEVVNGNVFGSVPKELISEDAVFALMRMGWQEVKVDILDFGKRTTDNKQVYDFCGQNFKRFIVISESKTQSKLALKFAV